MEGFAQAQAGQQRPEQKREPVCHHDPGAMARIPHSSFEAEQGCYHCAKVVRGYLVRSVIKRHNSAVVLQRHARGFLVRVQQKKEKEAAIAIQKRARGSRARLEVKRHHIQTMKATLLLQRCARGWKARKAAAVLKQQKKEEEDRLRAAERIQSIARGKEARKEAYRVQQKFKAEAIMHRSAVRIQTLFRQRQAQQQVNAMREAKRKTMNDAATCIRKHWLRCLYQARYLELKTEFAAHEKSVCTMQRYVRGFLVRLRMWRDAIKAEEELWAAVEIQRCWRGFLGRVRWELAYEAVWSRETAARRLQRYIRGWLARTRVHRLRKRMARADFEKARRRFKAAQKVQARVRGHLARKRITAYREYKVDAVLTIQRIYRGHRFRCRLWDRVQIRRTVQIQAAVRGFLVRNRRSHFISKVILIQRCYRHWLRVAEPVRRRKVEQRPRRRTSEEG